MVTRFSQANNQQQDQQQYHIKNSIKLHYAMYRKVIPRQNRAEKGGKFIDQMDFTVQWRVGRRLLSAANISRNSQRQQQATGNRLQLPT